MVTYTTQTEAAIKLGVSRSTLNYWHKNNMIPSVKRINGRPVYTDADLQEIIRIRGIRAI